MSKKVAVHSGGTYMEGNTVKEFIWEDLRIEELMTNLAPKWCENSKFGKVLSEL